MGWRVFRKPAGARLSFPAFWSTAILAPMGTYAAGFALLEQTGSGLGYAYAGAAASADDAGAQYFNPAALSLLDSPQLVAVAHGINLRTEFEDRGSSLPPAGLGVLPVGATRDDAGDFVPVPNVYFAWPMGERLALGFGINSPFGLITEYDVPWIGRFQGLRSELVTVSANPAVSYRVNDVLALGIGLNYQYADVELTNAVLLGPGTEGRALLDASDETWGWNVGALLTLPSETRIGLSYRSKLDYTFSGDTAVTTLAGAPIAAASGDTQIEATFPDSVQLSAAHPLREGLELRADVSWTNWSEVGTLVAENPATGLPRDVLRFEFEDAWRVALGVVYEWNDRWTLRGGTAWDEAPVKNEFRTVRLPDADRWWLSAGTRWRPSERVKVDLSYAHVFIDDATVDLARAQLGAPPVFTSIARGEYESSVDVLSVQVTWTFQ